MKTGLCSVTFRQLHPQRIVELVQQAGLDAVEWGGDVHVLPGNLASAQTVKKLTAEAGLLISSYGSYYTVLDAVGQAEDFAPVLDSALALGTHTIRIWPGALASAEASDAYRKTFVEKLNTDLDQAARQGIDLALEFHAHTLSDRPAAAMTLLDALQHPNLYTYWQPMYWAAHVEERFRGLEKMRNRVRNLHVFHWRVNRGCGTGSEGIDRRPLIEGARDWTNCFSVPLPPGEHYALLEFVRRDRPSQLLEDAEVLHRLTKNVSDF